MLENATIGLLAFDLDGTLLDSGKSLPEKNRIAVEEASARGVKIVAATGRFFNAISPEVRSLPLDYAITMNGASIIDCKSGETICKRSIPLETALEVMDMLSGHDVIYDYYTDGGAWIEKSFYSKARRYFVDEEALKLFFAIRNPVEDPRSILREKGMADKIMVFGKDAALLDKIRGELAIGFPSLAVSSSFAGNIEITYCGVDKGSALSFLASRLGIGLKNVLAFGDGENDIPMLEAAGFSVAMGNALCGVKKAAKFTTGTNDECGVALAMALFLRG